MAASSLRGAAGSVVGWVGRRRLMAAWTVLCTIAWAGLAWRARASVEWVTVAQLAVSLICVHKATLDFVMAGRLRLIGMKATAGALTAAGSALAIAGGILTIEVTGAWSAPDWWWMPALCVHLIANEVAQYGMHVRLLLPVSAVTVMLEERRRA